MEQDINQDAKITTRRIHRRKSEEIIQQDTGGTMIPTVMEKD